MGAGNIIVRDLDDPVVKAQVEAKKTEVKKEEVTTKGSIPLGYIPIEMSTGGRLGVPKVVHCRNFSTADLVDMSMFNTDSLPERLINVLNSMIFEKVEVADWPDKSIVELIVKIYVNYFTPILLNIDFPWDESDLQWLEEHGQIDKARMIREKNFKPVIDLDLRNVKIKLLDEEVKSFVTIKKKSPDGVIVLSAKFLAYPKYGDVITLRKAVDSKFLDEDRKYARTRQQYEMRERYLSEGKDISNLEPLLDSDYLKWQIHETKRAKYVAQATQALYLIEYNNMDLSKVSLDERIKYVNSPLFDVQIAKLLDEQYQKLDFGLNPEVMIKNPITLQMTTRRFSFRFVDIFQAIQSSNTGEYDISYDN